MLIIKIIFFFFFEKQSGAPKKDLDEVFDVLTDTSIELKIYDVRILTSEVSRSSNKL